MRVGSDRHLRQLKACRRSPPSQLCRRAVYHSKGLTVDGKRPRSGRLTRKQIVQNRRGRYVSRRKSSGSKRRYYADPSQGLHRWNRAAREAYDSRLGDDSEYGDNTEYGVDSEYGDGTKTEPRRSQRERIPNPKYQDPDWESQTRPRKKKKKKDGR